MSDRKYAVELEFDPSAQTNVVALLEEVHPRDVRDLVELQRGVDDLEQIFLVTRMSPAQAREVARKLTEFADACEAFGTVPAVLPNEYGVS
jgi:hypothetical protein